MTWQLEHYTESNKVKNEVIIENISNRQKLET